VGAGAGSPEGSGRRAGPRLGDESCGAPGDRLAVATGAGGRWIEAVERTVAGLGYDLVDVERAAAGLLRVTIDRLPGHRYPGDDSAFVTVDDCERVTRQLQYVLEVEGCDYARLEVSSPGLDRPLRRPADYERFAGAEVDVTLKAAFEGRRRYRGTLQAREGGWRVVFDGGERALDFALDEVREARLVPVVDFKGRRARPAEPAPEGDGADGGRRE
jgi:ribosome maturation factor RimP